MALAATKAYQTHCCWLWCRMSLGVWRVAMLKRAAKQKRRIAARKIGSATGKNEYRDVAQFSKKHHRVLNTCTHSKRTVLQQKKMNEVYVTEHASWLVATVVSQGMQGHHLSRFHCHCHR